MIQLGRWLRGVLLLVSLSGLAVPGYSLGLVDLDGRPRHLDEFTGQGKWTVVMFWASDCPVCNAEAHEYVLFHDQHHETQAGVLGISLDGEVGRARALQFVERHMVDFPNLIGEPAAVAGLYRQLTGEPWLGTPSFLVFAPDGHLRARQVGAVSAERVEALIKRESAARP